MNKKKQHSYCNNITLFGIYCPHMFIWQWLVQANYSHKGSRCLNFKQGTLDFLRKKEPPDGWVSL